MVNNQIVPAAISYQKVLVDNINGLKNVLSAADFKKAADTQIALAKEISDRVTTIIKAAEAMREERKKQIILIPLKNKHMPIVIK